MTNKFPGFSASPKSSKSHVELDVPGYERVAFVEDLSAGLKAIVSIHNTNLGPSCGGIRMLPYASKEEALQDVLALSRGMSYKSALAGIGFGGGKSVIIGDPAKKSPELFAAFGEFLEIFNGRYIAAKDMNITSEDLLLVKKRSPHVLGIDGEAGSSGDPSPVTARGILRGLEATVEEVFGQKSLRGLKVAIQGIGHVGFALAKMVVEQGGEIWVTDIDPKTESRAAKELGAHVVANDVIYDVNCDVFSPCARGATLNEKTILRLKAKAVVGCANNQLATPQDGLRLHERGILYAPDYAVNSGGIINIFVEYEGYDQKKALAKADGIYLTMKEIYSRAKSAGKAPFLVTDKLAEERLYGRKGA